MSISELQPKQGNVTLIGEIVEKGEARQIQKENFTGKVCDAKLKDTSGVIKLTLWNEHVDMFNVGDVVKVSKGYVNEWQGELQLSAGKFGSIELVEKASGTKELKSDEGEHILTNDEKTEADVLNEDGYKSDKGEHILTDDEKLPQEGLQNPKDSEKNNNPKIEEEEI